MAQVHSLQQADHSGQGHERAAGQGLQHGTAEAWAAPEDRWQSAAAVQQVDAPL